MKPTIARYAAIIFSCLFATTAVAAGGASAYSTGANAEEPAGAIGLGFGTLGFGLALTFPVNDRVNTRLGYNWLDYEKDADSTLKFGESKLAYNPGFEMNTFAVLADFHPWGRDSGFRLTGGAMYVDNTLRLHAVPESGNDYKINGNSHTLDSFSAKVNYQRNLAPYFGVGYGNAVGSSSLWHFSFDAGLLAMGNPDVSVNCQGANCAAAQNDIEAERRMVQREGDKLGYYTVLSFGMSWRF